MAGNTRQGLARSILPRQRLTALSVSGKRAVKRLSFVVLFTAGLSATALADPKDACQAAGGTYLTGVVVSTPQFRHGHHLHGVELSHTHVRLQSDQDHQVYDVAMDDVFASGYDQAQSSVPPPLAQIHPNDRLELCGKLYPDGTGIDWVHTNCGRRPTRYHPDGWIKIIAPEGTRTDNLEGSTEYCDLWGRGPKGAE
jgi:hypothetical protein